MKKIILISGLALSFIATPALANCPSGNCAVEVNCATGVVTYTDAPIRVETPAPFLPTPATPTHQVVIQTTNGTIGTSGSYEQVQQLVQQVIQAPKAPEPDPCATGSCNGVSVNATTGVTQVLPLTPADIQQRLVDQYMNYARQLEMSIAAREAIIQTYVAPVLPSYTSIVNTGITETTTALIAPVYQMSNVVMVTKDGIKVTKKENAKALIRKKKK
jgi:hypothetical protein